MSEWDDQYYEDEPDGFGGCCYECGGRGWKVACIDDFCHGQGECIHGDPPIPCPTCNPEGERPDEC